MMFLKKNSNAFEEANRISITISSLKLTASLHLKMDGWKMKFPFGDARPIFQGLWLLVSRSVATNKRVFIC